MNSSAANSLKLGICGLGTVGGGTLALLENNGAEISLRTGLPIEVIAVASRSLQPGSLPHIANTGTDPFAVANDPDVDVVIETIGGFDPAFKVVKQALSNGKHVITANKALIAERGGELISIAATNNVILAFESAVAGGIPIPSPCRFVNRHCNSDLCSAVTCEMPSTASRKPAVYQ